MTNTLTYSTAVGSTWTGANSAVADFGRAPVRFTAPNQNPSSFHQPVTQILENINYLVRHTCEIVTDHSALVLVAGIVTGMFGMATALGISITL